MKDREYTCMLNDFNKMGFEYVENSFNNWLDNIFKKEEDGD